ncbi:insulin-like growth factor-binding protein complex acid labile subunit [Galendromus occidentalis]|uniref:Insulin-like growth factor-binding protein complex acid labile subunit n=1 Tax=Galendromus occidentalis TaxID=34638 RepID=A0AAJ6QTF3_9ACAR|nr:insulin-like growth factor-binding protein complex acid labile subunit [Galendromus occidentalis]
MLRVFVFLLCLATAIHARSLCDLSADDGIRCECTETEAVCEPTRPLESLVPADHRLPYEKFKSRRNVRTITSLLLQSPDDKSLLKKFPNDIFKEPLHFKVVTVAHGALSVLEPFTAFGSDIVRELTISECDITELKKKAIVGLKSLMKLDLSMNLMTEFGTGVLSDLPMLEELIIAHSELKEVKAHAFVELGALKSLSLKDNKLTSFDNELLTGLERLERLDLSYNFLEKIDDNSFVDVPRLTHIDLTGNRLLSVTPTTFKGLYFLRNLSMGYNDLTSLPDAFLRDSRVLKHLNLERNRLRTVTLDSLHGLQVIRPDFFLDLRFNPLTCSCDLYYLTELRKRRLATMANEFEDPPEFRNLQCRVPDGDSFEPRVIDDELFVKNQCQELGGLAQHIPPPSSQSISHSPTYSSASSLNTSTANPLRPLLPVILAALLLLRLVEH